MSTTGTQCTFLIPWVDFVMGEDVMFICEHEWFILSNGYEAYHQLNTCYASNAVFTICCSWSNLISTVVMHQRNRKWLSSRIPYYSNSIATFCILLISGDTEQNPGPKNPKRHGPAPRCVACENQLPEIISAVSVPHALILYMLSV